MNNLFALLVLSAAVAQEDREGLRKVYETVRPSYLGVDVWLRKKTRLERAEIEEDTLDNEGQQLHTLSENQQVFETWGVAVEKDLVLLADRALKASDVEKIELTDSAGDRLEAKIHAVGRRHDFILLKASGKELTPLAFGDWRRPALGESFHVTYAERPDGKWHLNVSPYIMTNAPLADPKEWFCIDAMRLGAVVSDKDGRTVGVALDQYLWVLPDGRSSFLGKAVVADERLLDLEKKYEDFRRALPGAIRRVEVVFRAERGEDFMPADDAKSGRAVVFGVTVDDRGTLLVPYDLSREQVRRIEDIKVVDKGRSHAATFVGSFKGFGGMLVRAESLAGPAGAERAGRALPPGEIFFTAAFEDRFGRNRTRLDYNRLFRTERGLKGADRLQPRRKIKPGTFLLDFDGRPVGFATADKKDEDLEEVAAEATRDRGYADRYRSSYVADYLRRLVFFSEIDAVLSAPAAHFDAKAVPMTKKEEKKLVWLGVEFQEFNKALAEALGVQERDLTNDGRRGLLVTAVYPGSPAQMAGLRVDDVLLTLQAAGDFFARDLIAEADRHGYPRGPYGGARGGTPWKPAKNYLTTMLTEVGAGRKVAFQYSRGKDKGKIEVALEGAPRDYETAERYKDEGLGFTVKELTYEVRYFQKLEPVATGVVVSKVESGGRADVAKLPPLSIIRRVNEVEVKDLNHFKDLVSAGKGLTLTTISYGQTKLVEITRE